jgi:acyl carrier protein
MTAEKRIAMDGTRRFFEMDEPQVYARLTQIFEDVFDEDSIQLTSELTAKDVDGWDSLAHIRLILTIERAFKVKFSTSEIGKLQNVGELVALIKARA